MGDHFEYLNFIAIHLFPLLYYQKASSLTINKSRYLIFMTFIR